MADKITFDYQKLTPYELHVLDVMGQREAWTFMEFKEELLKQGTSYVPENKDFNRGFLKQRANLFGKAKSLPRMGSKHTSPRHRFVVWYVSR